MGDLLTALGIVLVLVVGAWHVGSPLLRVAALCCYLGAGLLLLAAGQGDVSPWAAPAVFCWGSPATSASSPIAACSLMGTIVGLQDHADGDSEQQHRERLQPHRREEQPPLDPVEP